MEFRQGAEQLFQNDKTFSFGAGAEYKSSHHSRSIVTRNRSNKLYKTTNVYGIGKYNVLKKEDGSNPLYVVGRLGYGFAGTSKALKDEEITSIRKITETINRFAEGGSIELVGHTDSTGSEKYNLKLSEERAKNLAKLLRDNGLSDKITIDRVLWYGEEFPIDTNATPEGRYNNRRVDLFFKNVDFENVKLTNE